MKHSNNNRSKRSKYKLNKITNNNRDHNQKIQIKMRMRNRNWKKNRILLISVLKRKCNWHFINVNNCKERKKKESNVNKKRNRKKLMKRINYLVMLQINKHKIH